MNFSHPIVAIARSKLSKSIFIQNWLYSSPTSEILSPLASPQEIQTTQPTIYINFCTSHKIEWLFLILVSAQMRRIWRKTTDQFNNFSSSWHSSSMISEHMKPWSDCLFYKYTSNQPNPLCAPKASYITTTILWRMPLLLNLLNRNISDN